MGLPVNDKNKGKIGTGANKGGNNASKFIAKPSSTKASGGGASKKPIKTGGARGS
jgi:hypothetical protein